MYGNAFAVGEEPTLSHPNLSRIVFIPFPVSFRRSYFIGFFDSQQPTPQLQARRNFIRALESPVPARPPSGHNEDSHCTGLRGTGDLQGEEARPPQAFFQGKYVACANLVFIASRAKKKGQLRYPGDLTAANSAQRRALPSHETNPKCGGGGQLLGRVK